MAKKHGKDTVVKVGANDISQYTNSSELERGADDHDTTCYGADDHVYDGGLGNHTFKMGGMYDSTATTGPRDVLKDTPGTKVTIVRQPEGTGSGLPQDSFSFLVTKYVESNPVADYITWSVEGKVSGAIDDTAQT